MPLIKYSTLFNDNIIDIVIPLNKNGQNFGCLDLGINSNSTLASSSKLIRNTITIVFASVWFMFILGVLFNMLIIKQPLEELSLAVKSIASGNFNKRINFAFYGKIGDLIFYFNDMAEKLEFYEKKNVDKLVLEKMKLETIVSTVADGAILVDTELRVLFVNQTALKVFEWSNLDIIGQSIINYFPSHINEKLLPALNSLVKSTYVYNWNRETKELTVNLGFNSTKTICFLLTTILDQSSNLITGVAIIMQDVSNEVKLSEAKNQFITNISHELRTPLCNIGSFLETLLDYHDSLSLQQQKQFLNIANNETKRLTILVNDILDLSRLESEHSYNLTQVALCDILKDLVMSSQIAANFNSIELILEVDPSIKFVWGNENSLWQVLANLLSNAIKFTSVGGRIVLRVYLINSSIKCKNLRNVSKWTRIEVIDEGIGLDPRDRKRIFDRFIRIENNTHLLEGTGLGLSIVKNIIDKHGAHIALQSQVSVGASFWFDLLQAD
uniref:two component sensor kinase n=1 Tax=Gloiopeltis furcata TaxID=42017 RepID=UPI0028D6B734|nr:two component sensor kinase [Gloiopeltis furcata]WMP13831.1 two component sensor kinase [Gloiopeltis furcata]